MWVRYWCQERGIYPMITGLWTPRFLFCQVSTQPQCRPGQQDCPIVPSVWRLWCCWTCCTLGSWTACDCFFLPGERAPQQQQNNPLPHILNIDDPIYEKHRVCWQVSAALQCRRVQRSCQTVRWASWPISSCISSTPSCWTTFNSTMFVFEGDKACIVQENASRIMHIEVTTVELLDGVTKTWKRLNLTFWSSKFTRNLRPIMLRRCPNELLMLLKIEKGNK